MREYAARPARPSTVVLGATARRAWPSALVWGALFGLLIANEALTYGSTFPTEASRQEFAATFGSSGGLSAVIGPGRHLDTLEGVVAWRVFGLMVIVGAIWGLLTATKLFRGEEDSGRWELLLAGRTSRRHATVQALGGVAIGWCVLVASTAVITVVAGTRGSVGLPVAGLLFYALAGTASAALFLAVGALTSQLAGTRRQATGWAALAFGVSYLVRLVADSDQRLGWLRWASPLGWIENTRPLTAVQPWALLPVAALVAALVWASVLVAGRRDVGVGAVAPHRVSAASPADSGPGSAVGLVWRLERWVVVSWVVGLGVLALVFGITASVAERAGFGSTVGETVGRLGGAGSGVEAWIGYEFLYLAAILAFAAAGQVAALRAEEASGHLDNLLCRSVSRSTWLGGRLAVGLVLVGGSALAAAVGGWAGVAAEGVGPGAMLRAGLNLGVPAVFVLGVGALLYGVVPRLAAPALYVLVLWSFVVATFGTTITDRRWVLDTGLLTHLGPVPATGLHLTAVGVLLGTGALAAVLGTLAFGHRDLSAA